MYNQLLKGLSEWKATTTERQKLQHTYLAGAVVLLLVAGLISLLDNAVGQNIAYLALAAVIAFLVNGLVWRVIITSVLERINEPAKPSKK